MGDGASTPNSIFGSFSANTLDYDLMDELLYDGYWLETTQESNLSSFGISNLEPNMDDFIPNPCHRNCGNRAETSDFDGNPFSDHSQTIDFGKNESRNREVILANSCLDKSENFLIERTEPNKRLWIAPTESSSPYSSVKGRLMRAIEYLGKLTKDSDVLIQIWVPVRKEGKQILTTDGQPFAFSPNSMSLANYRNVSKSYHFAAEENSKEFPGLPGRVFLKKSPEWTPDVRFFKVEEYPRVNYAQMCNVSGSLALPVFERESGICLGVVEIVTTNRIINYRLELENICKALETVDLRSSEISCPSTTMGCDASYQSVLTEIRQILKSVCDEHGLPLAQTWAPCIPKGKSECLHSNKTHSFCVSTIDSACYVRDEQVRPFHEACSEHYLLQGEGMVGEAFKTNQPCFATDVTAFTKTEYPLSHYAKMFNLHGSVAIRLRSVYTGSADFVLEFFLPSECNDAKEQWHMLESLSSGVQRVCKSLRILSDDEVKSNYTLSPSKINTEESQKLDTSFDVGIMWEGQRKGKVDISLDCKEDELEVFEEKFRSDNEKIYPDLGSKEGGESGGEFVYGAGKKPGDKRRMKSEKNISLAVLQQYFAGSLKDAAKSLGVCPTTLKRICRQHGITRWPSRKIKKVGHSLRKLQLVIDSVQGVEGPIQLGSFYSSFPELTSTSMPNISLAPQLDDLSKPFSAQLEAGILSPDTATSKSLGSQSSSSSFSTEGKQPFVATSLVEQPNEGIQEALNDVELHEPSQKETKLLVSSQIEKHNSELPIPLPNDISHISRGGSGFHVKATFGVEKVRFTLPQNWAFGDVKKEILRRFHIGEDGKVDLKYLDDDSEWVLLTCDADLEECLDIHKSTGSHTIKINVHRGFNSNAVGSFGSSGWS